MEPLISVQNISKKYGGREVLKNVSLELFPGQITAIIGPSGSGKTTLLRCLNCLTRIDSGKIALNGFSITSQSSSFDIRALRENVGMVFQQFNLWPHMTVIKNLIEAPMLVRVLARKAAEEKARAILKQVGLSEKEKSYPHQLSVGEQQRVAIARALVMDPQVLLLDEITSALDPELVSEVLDIVRAIASERKRIILIVTHEMNFAKNIADEVVFLDQGSIVERGKPEKIFNNPEKERTRQFLAHFSSRCV